MCLIFNIEGWDKYLILDAFVQSKLDGVAAFEVFVDLGDGDHHKDNKRDGSDNSRWAQCSNFVDQKCQSFLNNQNPLPAYSRYRAGTSDSSDTNP